MAQNQEEDDLLRMDFEEIINAVVVITHCYTQSFDEFEVGSGDATGFVVDITKGYILTNRHVVGTGPYQGFCKFHGGDKVDMTIHYIDPVHDFAFLRFDPSAVTKTKHVQLSLRPDLARVGLNIRIIGNDSGARLNIVDGILSRLDQEPYEFARGHPDFNTPYYQANTLSRGGSSGSPAINLDGKVIGIMAAGDISSSMTFLLPLNRVLRALQHLQNGSSVTRGDVGCWFKLKPYDECQGLGLWFEDETKRRGVFQEPKDLPVVNRVVPGGPSQGKIAEGDVILKIGDQLVSGLHTFDEIFDENVGKMMKLQVQRGPETLTVDIEVQNLHQVIPDRFVLACGTVFNTLSYTLALKYVFLHPNHGYAVVRYDPQLVDAPVRAAELSPDKLKQNDEVYFIGFNSANRRSIYEKTTVTTISPIDINMDWDMPRTRATNVDVVTIATHLGIQYDTGILTDINGTVRAFWLPHYEYHRAANNKHTCINIGLPAHNVLPILSQFHQETVPRVQILSAEFELCLLADACSMGMTESSALAILEKAGPDPRSLKVVRRMIQPDERNSLLEGDLLVSLDGNVVFDMSGLQVVYTKKTVKAEVVRDGRYVTLDISTINSSVLETRCIVYFGGAAVQIPHLEVRRQAGELPSEVYLVSIYRGAPSAMAEMDYGVFITEVNHKPTPDLGLFFDAIKHIGHNTGEWNIGILNAGP
ncbi:putative nuclear serine protease 2 protein [Eutypa lata UCREL1]|uniref:Pro-apoptotic serine protease NMA111 n=1 Tax=Eutypa lata (strain UCR-EL1) TaxID=1287681 RepID=M7T4X1_EUTLA|nr:putative nuclear serine protease 2 protein [Eutypa lata UCREL1]